MSLIIVVMEQNQKKKNIALKQFLVYIVSTRNIQITDIITEARALEGVVTISIFEPTRKMTETKNLTKIKLKFLEFSDNLKESIKKLRKSILEIDGVITAILKIKKSDVFDKNNEDSKSIIKKGE